MSIARDLTSPPQISGGEEFQAEVSSRFGLVPNFFQTAGEAPGLIRELWGFAKSAYLNNPLPPLFKERLFVHLSRFCQVRYCIVRHVGFLIGAGHPSGDPHAPPESVDQVVELLRRPGVQDAGAIAESLDRLAAFRSPLTKMPESGSETEWDVFVAASVLFNSPSQGLRARAALRAALGGEALELLTAYLAFIRTAHYWTQTHPELAFEEDVELLMRQHEELAKLMLDPTDGERCQIGARLFDELESLRAERDDRVALREALARNEEAQRHQRLLIDELNHRVKNTLAIIQSIATQTLRSGDTPPETREAFMARLMALASAHDILTAEKWNGAELRDLLVEVLGIHSGAQGRITFEGPAIRLRPQSAVAVAMATHELATNALKYGALSIDRGLVHIHWAVDGAPGSEALRLCWSERGGPLVVPPSEKGFGSRLLGQGIARELNGDAHLEFRPDGVLFTITAPLAEIEGAD
ncbi:sensor histidine kinase [Phenylobacterium sp.]|uniref:sensor histidine kinase n=1 Tax=Phenylobacterium sp. TaxID=1871053 RepID=UPI0035AD8C74